MSKHLLHNYYNKLDETIRFGGSRNETTVEHAFIQLVNSYAERRNLMLVPKIAIKSLKGTNIIPDGALKNALRLDFGYWESKDIKDDIDKEIQSKINGSTQIRVGKMDYYFVKNAVRIFSFRYSSSRYPYALR